jgi:predicted Rossmann-fold nucleotide-binding protein
VKGSQLLRLKADDWILRNPPMQPFPGIVHKVRQSLMVEHYIEQQPCYPFLKAIESGLITSQGVLLSRYFPSPLMKRMLLSYYVQSNLMGLYFQVPSRSNGYYFSQEDRAMLIDLVTFGIPVYWVDEMSRQILQYIQRPNKTSGMFVPLKKIDIFEKATFFGIYGSNLTQGNFENELKKMLQGLLQMRLEVDHPLLNKNTPLALVTGGGPGAMEMGNRLAKELQILSCANIVDFELRSTQVVNEQRQNPYVEAKMTYRLDHLIERQAEFYLDFPIFVMGGIGTDFEYALEELRHKVGSRPFGPIILFGDPNYWKEKITPRFQLNLSSGTIKGSEWVSNSFFCISTAQEGLEIYHDFFNNKLKVGPDGPIYPEGFVVKNHTPL